ncbi:MAG TPA: type II secretion system F family protein [Longimicrobiaceae bacterium]|nr:type II secretion system F family protein [Longimicrobiaceae bacterium]
MVGGMGEWIGPVLAFLAVAMGFGSLAVLLEWLAERRRRRQVGQQLERLSLEGLESVAPGAGKLFRSGRGPESGGLPALVARIPRLKDLAHRLEQAGLGWTVKSFLLLSVGLAVAAAMGTLLATRSLVYAAAAAPLGALLPYLYVSRRRARRLDAFEERFPDTIDLLGRAIRAGHPLSAGLKMVAEETDDPIATEFRQVFEEQRFGLLFEDSVTALADRVPLTDVRIFVTALLIQREVGGNLAEILDNLSSIIRQRFTLRRQVRVLTAEGRLSGYVLTALPIAIGLWVFVSNPAYINLLFEHPAGRVMVAGAVVMQGVGFLWMRKITNIEY